MFFNTSKSTQYHTIQVIEPPSPPTRKLLIKDIQICIYFK